MPGHAERPVINGEILFPMTALGWEPRKVPGFFKPETFETLKQIAKRDLTNAPYDPLIARFGGGISITPEIEKEALDRIRDLSGIAELVPASHYLVKYQIHNGCIPSLWEHTDQNGSQFCVNITIEKTIEWQIMIERTLFGLEENSAVIFSGQLHDHARPNYPSSNPEDYVIQLFLEYVLPDHWAEIGRKHNDKQQRFHKYGRDGDMRYFNKKRYFPLPDPPTGSKHCNNSNGIASYQNVLRYYEHIADNWTDEIGVEKVDAKIIERQTLFPGVEQFFIESESAETLCGLIRNAGNGLWQKAAFGDDYVPDEGKPDNIFVDSAAKTCHGVDPLRRYYESVDELFDYVVAEYKKIYPMREVESRRITLLRCPVGVRQTTHADEQPNEHRVITVVAYYNDSYSGGEFTFANLGITIKPKAGQILVFPSNYLFNHEVNTVTAGVRYSSNRFYHYKQNVR